MALKDNDEWGSLLWGLMILGAFLKWIGYENLGSFLQHWALLLVVVIVAVIWGLYFIFWWLPLQAIDAVTDDSPAAIQRRERWQVAIYSGLGAGFGSLIFEGQLWAGTEETFAEFLVTAVIIALASWMFFERITELVFANYRSHASEQPEGRKPPALLIVGTILLVTVLDMSVHSAVHKKASEAAQLGALVELLAQLVIYVLSVGLIASSWVKGARQKPSRAARKGAITGAIIGAVSSVLVAVVFYAGKLPLPESVGSQAAQQSPVLFVVGFTISQLLMWTGFGFAGGWAVDKRWGSCPTRGILLALTALSTVLAIFSYITLRLPESFEAIFMAVGWGMGLLLHGDVSDRVLELGGAPVEGTEQQAPVQAPPPPRAKPTPWLWAALALVLVPAVYIDWTQAPKGQRKVDSKKADSGSVTPAPAEVVSPPSPQRRKTTSDSSFGRSTAVFPEWKSSDATTSILPESEVSFPSISIRVTDSCNSGQQVRLRFFDMTDLSVPAGTGPVYVLNYGDDSTFKVRCYANDKICYGASDVADDKYWAAGVDGTKHGPPYCFSCNNEVPNKMINLTCPR